MKTGNFQARSEIRVVRYVSNHAAYSLFMFLAGLFPVPHPKQEFRECAALLLPTTASPSSHERVGQEKVNDAPLEMPPSGDKHQTGAARKGRTEMKVTLGQGADKIVSVINKYLKLSLGQWTRAMYKNLKQPNCLWFPQCSCNAPGAPDAFKKTLSAENWVSADGKTLYERAKTASMDSALNTNNALVRITFANLLPRKGYEFIGVFEFVGRKNGFRVYKRISDVTDSNQW